MKREVVLKYSEALDQFLQIRVLGGADLENFLRGAGATRGRDAYYHLVVRTCVLGAEAGVGILLDRSGKEIDEAAVAEHLYHLCVDVNPGLEIHQVTVPEKRRRRSSRPSETAEEASEAPAEFTVPRQRLRNLEEDLNRQIVGQTEAAHAVAQTVRKAGLRLRDQRRPVGAFLLVGQTGTGKTEFSKAICRLLFGDLSRLVRVDCSEYALPHEYAKLIGAPPGYIGHNEGGYLTETVRDKRQCVVLFDEVEKAHSKMHHLLLQLLDEGMLTDGKGAATDFTQCLVMLTSNLGTRELQKIRSPLGFAGAQEAVLETEDVRTETMQALRSFFRPEFLNRLDDILVFNPLGVEECSRIVARLLDEFAAKLRGCGIRLRWTREVCRRLAREGFSDEYGARELRRLVQKRVEDPIADSILWNQVKRGQTVSLRVRQGKVEVAVPTPRAHAARA